MHDSQSPPPHDFRLRPTSRPSTCFLQKVHLFSLENDFKPHVQNYQNIFLDHKFCFHAFLSLCFKTAIIKPSQTSSKPPEVPSSVHNVSIFCFLQVRTESEALGRPYFCRNHHANRKVYVIDASNIYNGRGEMINTISKFHSNIS